LVSREAKCVYKGATARPICRATPNFAHAWGPNLAAEHFRSVLSLSTSTTSPNRPNRVRVIAAAALVLLAAVFGGLAVEAATSPADAAETAPVIIDVRTADEFAAGHLEGAVNIPLDAADFKDQVAALDLDGEYILHCGTGARADRVAEFMQTQGFALTGSYSLEEARDLTGATVIGDLDEAAALNPTTNEIAGPDGPPTCALTGESLFGVTR